MTKRKKDKIPPATLYQFREVTKSIESPQTPPQKLRIVTYDMTMTDTEKEEMHDKIKKVVLGKV